VDAAFDDEHLAFDYSWEVTDAFGQDYECETDIAVSTLSFDNGAAPEELDTTVEVHEDDDTSGTIVLPDLEGGEYELLFDVVTCVIMINGGGTPFTEGDEASIAFARLLIDKDVEGDVPDGTTFTVEVTCATGSEAAAANASPQNEDTVYEREFDADGGTEAVYFYDPAHCTIAETEDGGAMSTSIDPDEVEIIEPADFSTTVTNTFPEAEEVDDTEEDDEDEAEDDGEDESEEPEAEAAEPVEAEPDFTG
jgi:hypothetical protein